MYVCITVCVLYVVLHEGNCHHLPLNHDVKLFIYLQILYKVFCFYYFHYLFSHLYED